MSRRIPGPLRWSLVAALAAVVAVALAQSWASSPSTATGSAPLDPNWSQTRWGPLGPADRDLLQKVRLAGLWEGPTGQQAEQQAASPAVRGIAKKIGDEHHDLDGLVRHVADQLGVPLPSRPNDQQIGWMNDLTARTGADYDRQFVQILRTAHGTVLPLITQVRVGTRNDLMRRFATDADAYVTRHIGYLESTGMVDYAALPAPPDPASVNRAGDLLVPALVVGISLLAAFGLLMTLYRRGRPGGPGPGKLLPAAGSPLPRLPGPRRPRDDEGRPPLRRYAPVGPPDPWDELGDVPPVRTGSTSGAHRMPDDALPPDPFEQLRREPDRPHRPTSRPGGPRRARIAPRSRYR